MAQEDAFGPTPTESDLVAENIVSVASGHSQSVQSAPGVTSIITARQIKNMGARNLYDVLRTIPGFFLGENTIQIEPIISVRGFKSSFNQNVLILLDGIPQTDHASGDRLAVLGNVPLDIIERIEIMRGPGSALYGADAYSAVINIITRQTPLDKTQITLEGGSQQTRDARLISGGRVGDFAIVGALQYQETDGNAPFIAADLQTNLDALFGTRASLAPGEANTHLRLLGAQLNATGEHATLMLRTSLGRDIGMGIGLANALDPFGQVDITTVEGKFEWRTHGQNWIAKVLINELFYEATLKNAHYFPPGAFGVFPEGVITNSNTQQYNTRLQGTVDYTGIPSHRISVGMGAETGKTQQKSESRNFSLIGGRIFPIGAIQEIIDPDLLTFGSKEFSHDFQFVYVQDEWALHPNWTLTWGLRYDHYSDYGNQVNPRIALVWDTSPYLTTKLLYGRGFRGPSLVDTHARQVPALIGNPNLKPETMESLELAFDYRIHPDLLARLNLFYQQTDDQIRIVSEGGPTSLPMNVAQQIGRGAELEAWWDIDRYTQLYGAYSYQDSTDKTTNADVGYHPHHLLYARLQRRQKPWLFTVQARYVGQRERRVEDSRLPAETYAFVDGLVRYELTPDFEVGFEVRNLFDLKAEDAGPGTDAAFPSDIPLPGRIYYFTVTGRF
jgi:iron complex outermembrane receptor protein